MKYIAAFLEYLLSFFATKSKKEVELEQRIEEKKQKLKEIDDEELDDTDLDDYLND